MCIAVLQCRYKVSTGSNLKNSPPPPNLWSTVCSATGLNKLTIFLVHCGFCNCTPSTPFWSNVSNYKRDLTVLQAGIPPCFLHSILVCVLPWSPLSPSEFSEWKVETGRQEISAFLPKVLKNVSWDEDPGQWLLLETDSLHGMVHWLAVCNNQH